MGWKLSEIAASATPSACHIKSNKMQWYKQEHHKQDSLGIFTKLNSENAKKPQTEKKQCTNWC